MDGTTHETGQSPPPNPNIQEKRAILHDLLRRPLDDLIPFQDIIWAADPSDFTLSPDTNSDIAGIFGADAYERIVNHNKIRNLGADVIRDLDGFVDPELESITFRIPPDLEISKDDSTLPPINLPGNMRYLVSKQRPRMTRVGKLVGSSEDFHEDSPGLFKNVSEGQVEINNERDDHEESSYLWEDEPEPEDSANISGEDKQNQQIPDDRTTKRRKTVMFSDTVEELPSATVYEDEDVDNDFSGVLENTEDFEDAEVQMQTSSESAANLQVSNTENGTNLETVNPENGTTSNVATNTETGKNSNIATNMETSANSSNINGSEDRTDRQITSNPESHKMPQNHTDPKAPPKNTQDGPNSETDTIPRAASSLQTHTNPQDSAYPGPHTEAQDRSNSETIPRNSPTSKALTNPQNPAPQTSAAEYLDTIIPSSEETTSVSDPNISQTVNPVPQTSQPVQNDNPSQRLTTAFQKYLRRRESQFVDSTETLFESFQELERPFEEICNSSPRQVDANEILSIQSVTKEFMIHFSRQWNILGATDQSSMNEEYWSSSIVRSLLSARLGHYCLKSMDFNSIITSDEYLQVLVSCILDALTSIILNLSARLQGGGNSSRTTALVKWCPPFFGMLREVIEKCMVSDICISKITVACNRLLVLSKSMEVTVVENFVVSCTHVLICVFSHYSDERKSLLDEVLSLAKQTYPSNKTHKLINGKNIHATSYLLLNFVQFINPDELIALTQATSNDLSDESLLSASRKASDVFNNNILSIEHTVLTFCRFLEGGSKNEVECFIDDLLVAYFSMVFPVTTIMLNRFVFHLCTMIEAGNLSQQCETTAVGILGQIGIFLSRIGSRTSDSLTDRGSTRYLEALKDLQASSNKNRKYTNRKVMVNVFMWLDGLFYFQHLKKITERIDLNAFGAESKEQDDYNRVMIELARMLVTDDTDLNTPEQKGGRTREDMLLAFQQVSMLRFHGKLNYIIDQLTRFLGKPRIKTRAKTLRALSGLINENVSLLLIPKVSKSVSLMLNDSSPMVRDSVIDLISGYCSSRPETIGQFYVPITDCLSDESIQVRKRVAHISREIFFKTPDIQIRAHIVFKLLRRMDDEDDQMVNLVVKYLVELLFPSTTENFNLNDLGLLLATAMDKAPGTPTDFEKFLKIALSSPQGEEIRSFITKLIEANIDYVMLTAETEDRQKAVAIMKLITVFVDFDGSLFPQKRLTSLQPYLMDESTMNDFLRYYTLRIMRCVLPHVKVLNPEFIEKTISYLVSQISKLRLADLQEAIRCLDELCKIKNNNWIITNTVIVVLKHLLAYVQQFQEHKILKSDARILRLLNLTGAFGTFCRLEDNRSAFLKSSLGLKPKESITSLMARFVLTFCDEKVEISIREVALRNLLGICSTSPKLFVAPTVLNILDRELDNNNEREDNNLPVNGEDPDASNGGTDIEIRGVKVGDRTSRVKLLILKSIHSFLLKEESDSRRRNDMGQKSSTFENLDVAAFNGSGKGYINDGICTTLVQRYIDKVLKLCFIDDGPAAFVPIILLKSVVELGLENPKNVIPTIIALESSRNKHIRKIAANLHKRLFNKHESLVDSSYIEALKLAVLYRYECFTNLFTEHFFLPQVYSIISKTFTSSRKFVQSLAKVIKVDVDGGISEEQAIFKRDIIVYTLLNASKIEFKTLEEILILGGAVSKTLTRQGLDLYDQFKELESNKDSEDNKEIRKLACINATAALALLQFNNCLMIKYGLSRNDLTSGAKDGPDVESRQPPKVVKDIEFTLDLGDVVMSEITDNKLDEISTKYCIAMYEYIN